MNIDIDPKQLSRWLQITLDQRRRALTKSAEQYGPDNAHADQLREEIILLHKTQEECLRNLKTKPQKQT